MIVYAQVYDYDSDLSDKISVFRININDLPLVTLDFNPAEVIGVTRAIRIERGKVFAEIEIDDKYRDYAKAFLTVGGALVAESEMELREIASVDHPTWGESDE